MGKEGQRVSSKERRTETPRFYRTAVRLSQRVSSKERRTETFVGYNYIIAMFCQRVSSKERRTETTFPSLVSILVALVRE